MKRNILKSVICLAILLMPAIVHAAVEYIIPVTATTPTNSSVDDEYGRKKIYIGENGKYADFYVYCAEAKSFIVFVGHLAGSKSGNMHIYLNDQTAGEHGIGSSGWSDLQETNCGERGFQAGLNKISACYANTGYNVAYIRLVDNSETKEDKTIPTNLNFYFTETGNGSGDKVIKNSDFIYDKKSEDDIKRTDYAGTNHVTFKAATTASARNKVTFAAGTYEFIFHTYANDSYSCPMPQVFVGGKLYTASNFTSTANATKDVKLEVQIETAGTYPLAIYFPKTDRDEKLWFSSVDIRKQTAELSSAPYLIGQQYSSSYEWNANDKDGIFTLYDDATKYYSITTFIGSKGSGKSYASEKGEFAFTTAVGNWGTVGAYALIDNDGTHRKEVTANGTTEYTLKSKDSRDIFLDISNVTWWADSDAKTAVHWWKSDGTTGWSDFMTKIEDNIYHATIDKDATGCIFVRFNSTKSSTGNWDDKWNQSVDLGVDYAQYGNVCKLKEDKEDDKNKCDQWYTRNDFLPAFLTPLAGTYTINLNVEDKKFNIWGPELYLFGKYADKNWATDGNGIKMSFNATSNEYYTYTSFPSSGELAFTTGLLNTSGNWDYINALRFGPESTADATIGASGNDMGQHGDTKWQNIAEGNYKVRVTKDLTKCYLERTYALTLQKEGNGTVTSNADNEAYVVSGLSVTCTAQPADGYEIQEWYVDGAAQNNTTGQQSITMNADHTVKVVFVPSGGCETTKTIQGEAYDNSVKPSQGKEVATTVIINNWFEEGRERTETGYYADFQDTGNNEREIYYPIHLPAATYTFTVRFSNGGEKYFNIYSSEGTQLHYYRLGEDWDKTWHEATTDSYTLSEGDYYIGLNAKGGWASFDKIVITANSPVFCPVSTHTVSYSAGDNGTMQSVMAGSKSINSGDEVDDATSVTFTAQPADCYRVDKWYVNDVEQSGETGNTFTLSVTADVTVRVTFRSAQYNIQYATGNAGGTGIQAATAGGTGVGNNTNWDCNTVINFTAQPSDTYEVDYWTVNDVAQDAHDLTFSVTMTEDKYVRVYFRQAVHNIIMTGTDDPNLQGSAQSSNNGSITLTSVADPTCYFNHNVVKVEYQMNNISDNDQSYAGYQFKKDNDHEKNNNTTGFAFWYRTEKEDDQIYIEIKVTSADKSFVHKLAGTNGAWKYVYMQSETTSKNSKDYSYQLWVNGKKDNFAMNYTSGAFYITELQATNVTSMSDITATTHHLYVNPSGDANGDIGDVTGAGDYTDCDQVTVTATPHSGYQFVRWTVDGAEKSTSKEYTFSFADLRGAAEQVTLVAVFERGMTEFAEVPWTGSADITTVGGHVLASALSCFDETITFTWTGNGSVSAFSNANRSVVLTQESEGDHTKTFKIDDATLASGIYLINADGEATITGITKTTRSHVYDMWTGSVSVSADFTGVGLDGTEITIKAEDQNWWLSQVVLGPEHFQKAAVGDTLFVSYTNKDNEYARGALQKTTNYDALSTDGWAYHTSNNNKTTTADETTYNLKSFELPSNGYYHLITSESLTELQTNGVVVKGKGHTLTKVSLHTTCSNPNKPTAPTKTTVDKTIDLRDNPYELTTGFDLGEWEHQLEFPKDNFRNVAVGDYVNVYVKTDANATISFRCNVESIIADDKQGGKGCPSYGNISFDRTIDNLNGDAPEVVGENDYAVITMLVTAEMKTRLDETGFIIAGKGALVTRVESVAKEFIIGSMTTTEEKRVPTVVNNLIIYQGSEASNEDDIDVRGTITYIRPSVGGMHQNIADRWYTFALPFDCDTIKVKDEDDGEYYDGIQSIYRNSSDAEDSPSGYGYYYLNYLETEVSQDVLSGKGEVFRARWRYVDATTSAQRTSSGNETRHGYPIKFFPYIILWENDTYFNTNNEIRYIGKAQKIDGIAKQYKVEADGQYFYMYVNNTLHSMTLDGTGYVLNEETNNFQLEYRPKIAPFECYVQATESYKKLHQIISFRNGVVEVVNDNPTATGLTTNSDSGLTSYLLYDVSGRLIGQVESIEHFRSLHLQQGVYLLRNNIETIKIMY